MNPTRIPKEVLLPDWARRDMQVIKGDRVYLHSNFLQLVNNNMVDGGIFQAAATATLTTL